MRSLRARSGGAAGDAAGGWGCARRGSRKTNASVKRMEAILRSRICCGGPALRELEAQLRLGPAEIDLFDLVDAAVLRSLDLRIVELLVGGLDLHRSRERLGAIHFGKGGVVAVNFQ